MRAWQRRPTRSVSASVCAASVPKPANSAPGCALAERERAPIAALFYGVGWSTEKDQPAARSISQALAELPDSSASTPQPVLANARNSSNTGPFSMASSARMARAAGPPSITR